MTIESKFLNTYTKFHSEGAPSGKLNGDRILVEVIKEATEAKSKGGIILATASTHLSEFNMLTATVAVVLEVGSGYFDPDTKEDIPLSTRVGQVVWLADNNIRYLTTVPQHSSALPEKTLALANESSVIKAWPSIEAFNNDRAAFAKAGENNE
jgi:co-chaperonin GroES (HSP10)